jgi:S-adenosylmethionine synthetase
VRYNLNVGLNADPQRGRFELVERKGLGHPDTICDAIAEAMSRLYSRFCLESFGRIAHHWFDKVMLIGGEADIRFGEGRLVRPYTLIYAGKCAFSVGDRRIPVDEIARQAAEQVLATRLTGFRSQTDLQVRLELVDYTGPGRSSSRYRPRCVEDLPLLDDGDRVSNDANLLVGFSPLTPLEKLVLYAENWLNSREFKANNPDVGWDIKVIGSRVGDEITLLMNIPFLAAAITSMRFYNERKQAVTELLRVNLERHFDLKPVLRVNPADLEEARPYLVALGSVADTGDVGVTGRGNRVNGLITPMRPMSIEAFSGKNPVDHTGKLHAWAATELARVLAAKLETGVEVFIHTAKGTLTREPDDVMINVTRVLEAEEERFVKEELTSILERVPQQSRRLITDDVLMW